MTTGSPALAAYSLALTSLTVRSVYRNARNIKHESREDVTEVLISVQQTPLELTKDERLLASIPRNDRWRRDILDRLNRKSGWSLATGSSVAWVVIAFVVTLSDSFSSPDVSGPQGHAVGTLWLWLLCLVIGWLWVPTFSSSELRSAFEYANHKSAKRAAKKLREDNNKEKRIAKRHRKASKAATMDITSVHAKLNGGEGGQSTQEHTEILEKETGGAKRPPLNPLYRQHTLSAAYSYSTNVHTETLVEETGRELGHPLSPSHDRPATNIAGSTQPPIIPGRDVLLTKQEITPLNRDEHRFAATFNYSRIMRYLALVDQVFEVLQKFAQGHNEVGLSRKRLRHCLIDPQQGGKPTSSIFPRGALTSMFHASIFGLVLQCGTTTAATIIITFTPTVGLGCRSMGYIIYGVTAIVIMFLAIASTIFAWVADAREKYNAEKLKNAENLTNAEKPTDTEGPTNAKDSTASIAIALRRISFLLALTNGSGMILLSCLQFTNLLDNCYCNASVIGRGTDSYVTIVYNPSVTTSPRVLGIILSGAAMITYMMFLWVTSTIPNDIDDT